jgi:hypothetical protein
MWLHGIVCIATAATALAGVAAGLHFRRAERRWRWRWQELPSGDEHRGPPGGVYREARVALPLARAPRLVRLAAFTALITPVLAFAAWGTALLLEHPPEGPCYELVLAAELGYWAVATALAWRAAAALLSRNVRRLRASTVAIWCTLAAIVFAVCAVEFPLGWRLHLYLDLTHYDALVYELGVVQLVASLVPALAFVLAARRFRRELRLPTRYVEWGRGLIESA